MNCPRSYNWLVAGIFVLAVLWPFFCVGGTESSITASPQENAPPEQVVRSSPTYVGAGACVQCHQEQFDAWKGSHHYLAMQHANAESVLAEFNDSQYQHNGVATTFFKRDDQFYVNTDGPNGEMQDYEIKYTFGVDPLQQYLVELPGGKLQALSVAWDSRSKEQGGQRWFHLYPGEEIDYTDELHWTKLSQNWNHMCAECHSTNLKKNFDFKTNQFRSTWSDINVSCEACHGPGSQHMDWAKKIPGWEKDTKNGLASLLDERKGISWDFNDTADTAVRSAQRRTTKEIDTCAHCHSRRATITEDYRHGKPLMDSHVPALLTDQVYYPDGQIMAEDYVYGSFIQSKMYHKGVTCSDCHQPHSLKLRAPANQTCLQCHNANKYDTEKHHFHPLKSKGASCAECHMPPSNFMVIDPRHDHSIRIPRPDLSNKINTPNACNNCHADKTAAWADAQMQKWYGPDWSPGWHFGETLFEARQGLPRAGQNLAAVAVSPEIADIARATATSLLSNYLNRNTLAILPALLLDKSPMVRRAALDTVYRLPPQHRWTVAGQLLSDPVFAVRTEAARVLSEVPRETLTLQQQRSLDRSVQEYINTQLASAENPQSHINLGLLYLSLGDFQKAENAYLQARKLEPAYAGGYVNLADLYRVQHQENRVEAILLEARGAIGDNAEVEHALGLHYVRRQQMENALASLAKAVSLSPDNARYGYVYAVALYGNGDFNRAIKTLEQLHGKHPYDADTLAALVSYNKAMGNIPAATAYAHKLVKLDPRYGSVDQIIGP